ncbi:MAG: UDP-N-acetylglucosamine 1-carboxyvinyltransferase [Clostridiales bacterium]|nr:UDP-N-acetylglucosamine 1-carboxyvinyltransferase [Clostridiales bacterium]
MQKIVIKGNKKLNGRIRISGAKNSALPIMAASLLTKESVILHNIPKLGDVDIMSKLLQELGVELNFVDNTIKIVADISKINDFVNNPLLKCIRYSTHLIGALLQQFKEISLPLPGGCVIGTRRLDSHLLGFKNMGAKVSINDDMLRVSAEELHGCDVRLEFPSVGATENLLIAASTANGNSTIKNVAQEPEIVDLANFLNSMGAKITGAGESVIQIKGVSELSGTEYSIIPDRIETGTYIAAAGVTNGDLILEKTNPNHLEAVLEKFVQTGMVIDQEGNNLHVRASDQINPVNVITETYPGFPTDMQPIITTLLARANGESIVQEKIYDSRFNHVPELCKMGAKMRINSDFLYISGIDELNGAEIEASDIRCGGALILAGLCAKGKTTITGVNQILRGYENPVEKLKNVGAQISLC